MGRGEVVTRTAVWAVLALISSPGTLLLARSEGITMAVIALLTIGSVAFAPRDIAKRLFGSSTGEDTGREVPSVWTSLRGLSKTFITGALVFCALMLLLAQETHEPLDASLTASGFYAQF